MRHLCLYCGDQSRPTAVQEHDIRVHSVINLGAVCKVQEHGACLCWNFYSLFVRVGGGEGLVS